MHPHLKDILTTQFVKSPSGNKRPLHSSIPEQHGLLLQHWIRRFKPQVSLEIGLGYGISAMFLCEALIEVDAKKHYVIDNAQFDTERWDGIGLQNLGLCGYASLVDFIQLPSELALPRLLEQGERIDFAFIDGWHTFDQCLLDFYYVNRLLNIGGLIVFDDGNLPGVSRALSYISKYPAYQIYATACDFNEGFIRKYLSRFRGLLKFTGFPRLVALQKIKNDERPWDWHLP